jgi:hypothetical protein
MKTEVFISACVLISLTGFSQKRVMISKEWQNYGVRIDNYVKQNPEEQQLILPLKNSCLLEEDIGTTYYDLQTMASTQKRIHVFDDGTMGAVWTMGFDYTAFWDRGTGYNYYDGASWGPFPDSIIESNRSGWPEYAPYGENGEIVVSHISGAGEAEGLTLLKRENKGTGDWEELNFLGPPDCEDLKWPRIATGGVSNSVIHLLAVTAPTSNCGFPYQGQEVAILYSRSFDGGGNWNPENYVIPDIDSSYYNGFSADVYEIRADGDNVGILIGDPWIGLLLLKSTDGGDTWTKTIIWDHPYPFWINGQETDTFYCADGAHSLDFDDNGITHVVFGINRTYSDAAGSYWFPAVDGIGYWNENRPTFSNNLNALSPYGDPGSELEENYSLIGWTQDVNQNGQLDILEDWGRYYLGFSSMPQIIFDESSNILVLVFSSVTETYDNGAQNYRHLWMRGSPNGSWWGAFHDLTNDLSHLYDECVFPSLATFSDDAYYLTYQRDNEPGLAVRGDLDEYTENQITFMTTYLGVGFNEKEISGEILSVSQNQPNPFRGETKVKVELFESANVSLTMTTLTGQKVQELNKGPLQPGVNIITIDAAGLKPGVYFYTVKAGDNSITKKMIIK